MIQILTTGGTIEGLEYDSQLHKPKMVCVKIKDFLVAAKVSFDFAIDDVFNKDSRFINDEDRRLLAGKINTINTNQILITHGTITMVDTARFLGELNLDKTIVLVGSFVLGNDTNTDAPFNLGYAICALQTLGRGVYVAMNGRIFSWNTVIKNIKKNRFQANAN